jgi:predicted dehydrogenase
MSGKVKIGVFGGGRGRTMVSVMSKHPDAELVAICDAYQPQLDACKKIAEEAGSKIALYQDFDQFMQHDMDAVILANFATEHAPYAVRLLNSGRHVCSENVACQSMAEAVELVEAVERSGKIYTYAENCCYFKGVLEMQRIYQSGALGEFLHGEGEYVHLCESIWPGLTLGDRNHWRVWTPSTFYCTHSIGPLLTITGLRPTRISAYEVPNVLGKTYGRRGGDGSIIVCQMSNGGIAKFMPWCGYKREPGGQWFSLYGTKGMVETDRWGELCDRINVYTEESGKVESYSPVFTDETELSKSITAHGGADFYTMQYFLDSILDRPGKEKAVDVYQAMDMTLPGTLGYRSIYEGNIPLELPDLRDKAIRDKYRNDTWCVDPKHAGPGQPTTSSVGYAEVPEAVYEEVARKFKEKQ